MWKPGAKFRMRVPFRKKAVKRWGISMNGNASKWKNGRTIGLIGGGVGLLAGTTFLLMKQQGGGSLGQKGQQPSRSHISMS